MLIVKKKGNNDLLNREKTLFLCSKMTPIDKYADVFSWTDSLTEKIASAALILRKWSQRC